MSGIEKGGFISRVIGPKRRWRKYKARMEELPENYRATIAAVERYMMVSGGISKGDILMSMLEDLADLFEQSAAAGTSIREVVGDDPVEFVETFLQNYSEGHWISKERERLIKAIERAEKDTGQQGEPKS